MVSRWFIVNLPGLLEEEMQVVKDHYTQQSHSAAAVPPTCALCVPVSIPHTPTFTTTHCPQCWTHRREKCLQLVSPSPRKPVISGVTPRPQKVTKMFELPTDLTPGASAHQCGSQLFSAFFLSAICALTQHLRFASSNLPTETK